MHVLSKMSNEVTSSVTPAALLINDDMPTTTKKHRATNLDRRARNVSGGSSKTGLNLHFTQKEPPKPNGARNGQVPPEVSLVS